VTSTYLSVDCLAKNWSYVEQALAYRISCDIYTPYAGEAGILLHIGKGSWRWRKWNHPVCHNTSNVIPIVHRIHYESRWCFQNTYHSFFFSSASSHYSLIVFPRIWLFTIILIYFTFLNIFRT
jgi:hypothetical protein